MSEFKCPNCNSHKVLPSAYRGWLKCDDCLEVFD